MIGEIIHWREPDRHCTRQGTRYRSRVGEHLVVQDRWEIDFGPEKVRFPEARGPLLCILWVLSTINPER